jgi:phage terminase Nu1 subunit (DNA packaging protein)
MDDHHNIDLPPPQTWIDALAESEADLAAGRLVDGATVMRGLDESIARMQAKLAERQKAVQTR